MWSPGCGRRGGRWCIEAPRAYAAAAGCRRAARRRGGAGRARGRRARGCADPGGACALSIAAARTAFTVHAGAAGGGRAEAGGVVLQPEVGRREGGALRGGARGACARVEPIELTPGDDIVQLARDAIARGADALAAAGGDGTQALIATIAAEHNLPFACIPAGTRNHFALDLGVDREDVVGALDAFVSGGERVVDLAEVNGRTFVNNVSLGLYAEAVQREGYRDAKLRTIAETMPTVLGPGGDTLDLRFSGADGREHKTSAVVLVSNNPYRLGRAIASGTRPRLDAGVLGITVIGAGAARDGAKRVQEWSAPSFEVRSDGPVAAGIDGEALKLDPPLRFRTKPKALRVLIAPQHPGASPSANLPESPWDAVRAVTHIAAHGSS